MHFKTHTYIAFTLGRETGYYTTEKCNIATRVIIYAEVVHLILCDYVILCDLQKQSG